MRGVGVKNKSRKCVLRGVEGARRGVDKFCTGQTFIGQICKFLNKDATVVGRRRRRLVVGVAVVRVFLLEVLRRTLVAGGGAAGGLPVYAMVAGSGDEVDAPLALLGHRPGRPHERILPFRGKRAPLRRPIRGVDQRSPVVRVGVAV